MKRHTNPWCIAEFIPIVLVLIFALYTKSAVTLANSYLGRLIAVIGIICYTKYDVVYGLFACLIVILFYQLESISAEGYTNIALGEHMENDHYKSYLLKENPSKIGGTQPEKPVFEPSRFYNQHCKNNQLTYKEFTIKTEMAQHVYPEIQYKNGNICNPCDPNCEYSVTENRITTEHDIMNPKSSNDWLKQSWDEMHRLFTEPLNIIPVTSDMTASHGVISEHFSSFTK